MLTDESRFKFGVISDVFLNVEKGAILEKSHYRPDRLMVCAGISIGVRRAYIPVRMAL